MQKNKEKNQRILIVEDETALLKIMSDEFKNEGYATFEAHNGLEGLELAKKEKPDLILLDLIMPKMDGITMLKKLRQSPEGEKTRVLILTNVGGDAEMTLEALRNGVYEFYVKSRWSLKELKDRVHEQLSLVAQQG